jgi:hypothetical protein
LNCSPRRALWMLEFVTGYRRVPENRVKAVVFEQAI